jgi:Zn-finger nucleic acid-binding protein
MEAGTLNCPACGAAISQDSTQCQYCHALLQTVACPKCMGMMFAGTQFCPHCGVRVTAIQEGKETKLACPRCHADLVDVMVAGTPLDECNRCGGLWVDVSNFEHICSTAEAQEAATGLHLPPPVALDAHAIYLKCPKCANIMNRMNYASRSGIIINVCTPHGIWLDRDEIRQIIQFIRAGGLDHAREVELQELQDARRNADEVESIQPVVRGYGEAFLNTYNADEHAHLITGIASLANHFLGQRNAE